MHDQELTVLIEAYGRAQYEAGQLISQIAHAVSMLDVLKKMVPEETPVSVVRRRRGRPPTVNPDSVA